MGRELSEFKGQGVVIGCSHFNNTCEKLHFHQGEDNFYSIDRDPNLGADFVFDITSELPAEFKSRFKLTYLECLDYKAYNDDSVINEFQGVQGFQNIWDMTSDNGFIVINGCPREKTFRKQLCMRFLRYIELDEEGECILVAKNQELTFEQVIEHIDQLDPSLKKNLDACKTLNGVEPNSNMGFCELEYDDLFCLRSYILDRRDTRRIQSPNMFFSPSEDISIDELKTEIKQNLDNLFDHFMGRG